MPIDYFSFHLGRMCCRQLSLGTEVGVALVEKPPVQWCGEGGY